jgi:hypothetical protein
MGQIGETITTIGDPNLVSQSAEERRSPLLRRSHSLSRADGRGARPVPLRGISAQYAIRGPSGRYAQGEVLKPHQGTVMYV